MDSLNEISWGVSPTIAGMIIGWICVVIACTQFCYIVLLIMDVPSVTERMIIESNSDKREVLETVQRVAYLLLTCYLCLILVDLMASVLLLTAIQKKNHLMVLPWLIVHGFSIVLKIVSCLCLLLVCAISTERPTQNIMFVIFNIFLTVLYCWMWMIVLTLYTQLRDKKI